MSEPTQAALPVWHDEGRRVASNLDQVGSALVVGRDPEMAAWVALGIARAQSEHRRVAIADLVGEVGPLQALVDADDDPHGISDSFLYGVSLNKIARPADDAGNLFVLPSGSEAVATDEIFRSDRWRRLAGGFREVGALLLLVAHADTPGLDVLAASVDGVVLAGDAAGALPDAAPPLAVVGAPTRRPRPAVGRAIGGATAGTAGSMPTGDAEPTEATAPAPRRAMWAVVAIAALVLIAAVVLFVRQRATGGTSTPTAAAADSLRRVARDSARGAVGAADSARAAAAVPLALPALVVANPADSIEAAAWTVYVVSGTTPETAVLDPRVDMATLPVLALTPVLDRGETWYRLLVGAYATRSQAESLLVALRARKVLGAASGSLSRAPYALRVAERMSATDVPERVRGLAKRGIPVYPLSRGDGTVSLYAGAFETPEQAALLARNLQAAGIAPVLVYRTGRSL